MASQFGRHTLGRITHEASSSSPSSGLTRSSEACASAGPEQISERKFSVDDAALNRHMQQYVRQSAGTGWERVRRLAQVKKLRRVPDQVLAPGVRDRISLYSVYAICNPMYWQMANTEGGACRLVPSKSFGGSMASVETLFQIIAGHAPSEVSLTRLLDLVGLCHESGADVVLKGLEAYLAPMLPELDVMEAARLATLLLIIESKTMYKRAAVMNLVTSVADHLSHITAPEDVIPVAECIRVATLHALRCPRQALQYDAMQAAHARAARRASGCMRAVFIATGCAVCQGRCDDAAAVAVHTALRALSCDGQELGLRPRKRAAVQELLATYCLSSGAQERCKCQNAVLQYVLRFFLGGHADPVQMLPLGEPAKQDVDLSVWRRRERAEESTVFVTRLLLPDTCGQGHSLSAHTMSVPWCILLEQHACGNFGVYLQSIAATEDAPVLAHFTTGAIRDCKAALDDFLDYAVVGGATTALAVHECEGRQLHCYYAEECFQPMQPQGRRRFLSVAALRELGYEGVPGEEVVICTYLRVPR